MTKSQWRLAMTVIIGLLAIPVAITIILLVIGASNPAPLAAWISFLSVAMISLLAALAGLTYFGVRKKWVNPRGATRSEP